MGKVGSDGRRGQIKEVEKLGKKRKHGNGRTPNEKGAEERTKEREGVSREGSWKERKGKGRKRKRKEKVEK